MGSIPNFATKGRPSLCRLDHACGQGVRRRLELLAARGDEGGLLGGGEIGKVRSPALVGHFEQFAATGESERSAPTSSSLALGRNG